jgi:ribA/ribD-fused uncharacterized protein
MDPRIAKIIVHDENNIKGFFGEYRWLSNFHPCEVGYEGLIYPSSEHAYQAAKIEPEFRPKLLTISAAKVKSEWKKYPKLDKQPGEWDNRKLLEMLIILKDKFTRNNGLKEKLINTGNKHIEESNYWGDKFWGVCNGVGENRLGKLIMAVRATCR